jgi:hypothetical protein
MSPAPRYPTTWLGLIRGLLTLILIADVGYLLLAPTIHVGPVGHVLAGDVFGPDAFAHRTHQSVAPTWVTVEINRPSPDGQRVAESLTERLLYLTAHRLAFTLATIPMLILAWRLVSRAMKDDPFTPAMVRRLRVLGAVVLIGGLLSEVAEYVAGVALMHVTIPPDILALAAPDIKITYWWLMPGLILLAIAEVVKRGCALRAELDGVI